MTVRQLTRNIDSVELAEWQAYFQLNPPERADDWRAALVTAAVINSSGRARRKVKPEDFMPKRKARPKRKVMTGAEMLAYMKGRFGK